MRVLNSLEQFIRLRRERGIRDAADTVLRYLFCRYCKYMKYERIIGVRDADLLLHLWTGCTISEKCFIVGRYDSTMSFLETVVSPGETFIDVGANVGPFSLLVAKACPEARIIAFEPHPSTARRLSENCLLNALGNITVVQMAASSACGEVSFRDCPGSATNGIVSEEDGVLRVEATTIDQYCDKFGHSPGYVKIDTEGHELAVIRGMLAALSSSIKFVTFEANGLSSRSDLIDIYHELVSRDFHVGILDWRTKTFRARDCLDDRSPTGDYQALSRKAIRRFEAAGLTCYF